MIYVVLFYIVLMTAYFIIKIKHRESATSVFTSFMLYSVLLLILLCIVTVNYFFPPVVTHNVQLYNNLIVPGLVFMFLFIVNLAIYMVRLYVRKWNLVILKNIQIGATASGSTDRTRMRRQRIEKVY